MSKKMTTSEPTTGEIVMALRGCYSKEMTCAECRYNTGDSAECLNIMQQEVADRLESQEQTIAAMTARAEKAEQERDAAYDMLQDMRGCDECKHLARTWKEEPCNCCCKDYSMFEPSGLQPQDGEGKGK